MRYLPIILILLATSGCVSLTKFKYVKLVNYESKSYDSFNDEYEYVLKGNKSIVVRSDSFSHKTLLMGFGVPVVPVPETLKIDQEGRRIIQIENTSDTKSFTLKELGEILVLTAQYSRETKKMEVICLKPNSSIWLVIPKEEKKYIIKIEGENGSSDMILGSSRKSVINLFV